MSDLSACTETAIALRPDSWLVHQSDYTDINGYSANTWSAHLEFSSSENIIYRVREFEMNSHTERLQVTCVVASRDGMTDTEVGPYRVVLGDESPWIWAYRAFKALEAKIATMSNRTCANAIDAFAGLTSRYHLVTMKPLKLRAEIYVESEASLAKAFLR